MTRPLEGLKIAFLAAHGVEQVEHQIPWAALLDSGAQPELLSSSTEPVQAFTFPAHGDQLQVDRAIEDAAVDDYAGVILPGGTAGPDLLRGDPAAVAFIRAIHDRGKPVAAICHAPWLLIEAGLAHGRRLTSWPTLATDIRNAGGTWVDHDVVSDRRVITSRGPHDLPAFCEATIDALRQAGSGAASREPNLNRHSGIL